MMNKQQIKDMQECERMAEAGRDKHCVECSCNVCLVKLPKKQTANDFQIGCLSTIGSTETEHLIMNGSLGLGGEAGEVLDLVKKWRFQGHEFDVRKIAEELGDVMYYVATLATGIGYDLETIMDMNQAKLRRRYPNGFEVERSIRREEAR